MNSRHYRFVFFFFFSTLGCALTQSVFATHLRAGEITVDRLSCTSLTFKITITVYTNTGSEIKFGDGVLDFGDGSAPHVTPTIDNILRPDLGPGIGTVSYSFDHTYSGPGRYVISYLEPNRNAGILNMFNSVETRFYVETVINIDPFLGCSNTPRLLIPPIDKGCTGAAWFHNPGAFDPDGDSLSFELAIPKKAKGEDVNAYRDPNEKEFYDKIGIDYGTANEDGNGAPTFSINATSGTLIWDAPGAPGEYNISFLIKEWRKIQGAWILLGYVTRDMQIVIEDCLNQRPELTVPIDICVEAGTVITEDIFGKDPDFDSVRIEAFSQIFSINPSPASVAPDPPRFQSTTGINGAKLSFTWATKCEHIKEQAYQVVFKITDNPSKGPKLVEFKTWNIRVVGPAPIWKSAVANHVKQEANLEWEAYTCKNALTMQIWRRVDQFAFDPPECVTGMPDFLGYTMIDEVPITQSVYLDKNGGKGLSPGAQYCYRLVAVYPSPGGGFSYVSDEICLPPILALAPVITNVTVDRTSSTAGQITVKWRSPFDLDKVLFPPPYRFVVVRAEGFSGDVKIQKLTPTFQLDSVFVDTPLNTEETIFNYRIVLLDGSNVAIDTSSTASSVRLEAKSQFQEIELAWNADVPWSNQTQAYPMHLIYRGDANANEAQLTLIDSVNVNEQKFRYTDTGQYQNTPLKDTEVYCYRVMTRGAYGNPKIKEPLTNFSQIICAQPNDKDAPCKPELTLEGIDCDEYIQTSSCSPKTFSNLLSWPRPTDLVCRSDIRSYNIYTASKIGDPFELYVTNVRDTFFLDSNLPSFARCYKIAAVDRAGNVSELSDSICFDNCPYYELPNVFTPNGDKCNDLFSAFNDRGQIDESGNGACGPVDLLELRNKCARFAEKVVFTVNNRWGKEVYSYESGGERSIYIDWDGHDNSGKELSTGVYYYSAEVTFDVVDPSKKTVKYKGWVHLIR